MDSRITETAAAGAFAFLVGSILWPPGAVYWTALSSSVGTTPTLALAGRFGADSDRRPAVGS
ncbi:hypothetical protein KTS45_15820 [Halomicroarcula limicola]|uniref:Uncharacterized protein n=1 Tax=Haloarcula limicola TaxID=1429915 RepID=A0A8J7YFR3_9EURY|nr:hypothetical protein [Halomicroarcula limicola]MBV0925673.1 hypothetical protein [Halomicroarcula limicola]